MSGLFFSSRWPPVILELPEGRPDRLRASKQWRHHELKLVLRRVP